MTEEKCKECGCRHTDSNPVTFDDDPFELELVGVSTPCWMCRKCRNNSLADV